ncbi:MAG TPA: helix-turn-helix transcriptional regulator [Candidatus Elarobacter sp.]|jgi:transcriptional regulator with XRE-family HTH domain|nr:helix-turn-helix transcriptional regulator [Candidatus Elarobacter sp.]
MFDEMAVYEAIGAAIAAARRDKRISQEQLATALGLSRGSVSNIEAGRQKMLVHTLMQAALYLGIPATQLIPDANTGRAAEPPPEIALTSVRPLQRNERAEILAIVQRATSRNAE